MSPGSWPLSFLTALLVLAGIGCGEGTAGTPAASTTTPLPQAESSQPVPDPVAAYLERAVPDSTRVEELLEQVNDGLERWRNGDRVEGASIVDAALAQLPTTADWRPLIRAELLAPVGDTLEVRRSVEELAPEGDLYTRWGWSFLVQAYEEADDEAGALRAARGAAETLRDPGEQGNAWLTAGRLALATGDTAQATELLRRAMDSLSPDASAAGSAAVHLAELWEPVEMAERIHLGQTLLARGEWELGRELLFPILGEGPNQLSREVESAIRIGLGRALVELNRTTEARDVLIPLTTSEEDPEVAAQALFWKGRAALARQRHTEARELFLEAAQRHPSSPWAEEGLLALLSAVPGGASSSLGSQVLEDLLSTGVGSGAGELAAIRFGTGKYLDGDLDGALESFRQYLDGARRSSARQQARYWAALALERKGAGDEAQELLRATHEENPLSFYGTFAGDRLELPILPADLPQGPETGDLDDPAIRNALIRLRLHQRVPTAGSFAYELDRLERHLLQRESQAYDFAEALQRWEFPIQGTVLGRTIHREEGDWNLRLLRIVYPFPYREAIVRESRTRGLDPFFVAGLIRQESMFHPTIQSAAGAVGLMQLLPGTGREVAGAEGIRFSPAILGDPEINVRLGTSFLASMIRRFDGRAEDALSAYNAGPTRARQWRSRAEYRDTDVFLEHIPFAETRHYVKVVQQNTRIYTALYGCQDFQPCTGLSYRAAVARSPVAGGAPSSSLAR
jgi:soluble lytic murein transglycosylase-like protein